MICLFKKLWTYITWLWHEWARDDTNMFRTGLEAIGGALILFLFPLVSIIIIISQVTHEHSPTFLSFSYPLLTIALSDMYDAFSRMGENHIKNKKVICRIVLSAASLGLALWLSFADTMNWWHALPLIPLLLNGVILARDMLARWRISIDLMCLEMEGAINGEERKNTTETSAVDN